MNTYDISKIKTEITLSEISDFVSETMQMIEYGRLDMQGALTRMDTSKDMLEAWYEQEEKKEMEKVDDLSDDILDE